MQSAIFVAIKATQDRSMNTPIVTVAKGRRYAKSATMYASGPYPQRSAAHAAGLRGVPEDGRHLGPPAPVTRVRARRLLRQLQEQARHQALPRHQPPHHPVVPAG